ncbi:hypothetical protein LOTGIDRAFT_163698 [Lottia gigantea]|uniref:Cytochrome P450 CYP44 n=1 Tax=Lottia gigantea TaxID=225164 RepID=V3ZHR3_LOTGI|nr:hypothetical protein LOTGIDRAFT_163698 [Lottia gigantea]ESO90813.1 hypothetical protein LOTGIDRAFT_163698 [Lottia gigantea]
MWRNFQKNFFSVCGKVNRIKRCWISTSLGISRSEGRAVNSNDVSDYNQALPFEDIPGPQGIKYLGTLPHYMTGRLDKYKYQDILEEYFSKYGPIFKETLFDKTVVHVCHPDMIKVVYQDEGKYPEIEPLMEPTQKSRCDEGMSLGLGNTNDEQWYRLRSAVQKHMMRPGEVSNYLPQVNEVANEFVDKTMRKGYSDDFILDASIWSLESSGYISFGKRLGYMEGGSEKEAEGVKVVKKNDEAFTLATDLKFSLPFYQQLQTPKYKAWHEAENYTTKVASVYFENVLKFLETHLDSSSEPKKVQNTYRFLYSLLGHKNLSKKDMEVIVLSMFIDGLRTVVPVLISVLFCLSQSPRVQEKLFTEIYNVLEDRKYIAASDIAQMPYLKACVKETFRLHPNALEISRVTKNNMVLGGYQIPSGSKLNINAFNMYRNSDIFENPQNYCPERWLRGWEHAVDVHPYLLLPFGRGPRMCVGRRFAEQDLYVLISKFIQNCEPQWRGSEFHQQYKILMYPDRPVKFEFKSR